MAACPAVPQAAGAIKNVEGKMSDMDQNNIQSWYAPLKSEAPKKRQHRGKRKTLWIVLGVLALVILLIVASSLAFAGTGQETSSDRVYGSWMPSDPKDFFAEYYGEIQKSTIDTTIPRATLDRNFTLELEPQEAEEMSLQALYENCADTIVALVAQVEGSQKYYWGTGIIISEDGLILTNAHVIDGCESAEVTLYNNESYEAKLVGADAISDLAVLRIDARDLPVASFGDISQLAVGDEVAAIGNPLEATFRSTLTNGIISAIDRGLNYNGHNMNLLQTNAAINEGNSGGALFNMYGQVIGITNMKMMSYYSSIEGMGFAIPSTTVKTVVDALVRYGEVRGRPSLGITVGAVPESVASHYNLPEGLYISAVMENSDAARKGVQVGDMLVAVNGSPVYTTQDVASIKETLSVGDTMCLRLWREGETLELDVRLEDTNDIY